MIDPIVATRHYKGFLKHLWYKAIAICKTRLKADHLACLSWTI